MAVEGLIYWGSVSAASDVTMATIINTQGTQTRAAIEALIQDVAAAIIADDPTIIAAAEAAVADALENQLALSMCVHRESGAWVWDGPGGSLATHYVFPDHTGAQVVRATPFPIPLASPALDW